DLATLAWRVVFAIGVTAIISSCSRGEVTPVDRNHRTRNEIRYRRAQEHNGARDVLRHPPASERCAREDRRAALVIVLQSLRKPGGDPTWRHGVDANSIQRVRNCQRFRQLAEASFARAVTRYASATEIRQHRRDIDDASL